MANQEKSEYKYFENFVKNTTIKMNISPTILLLKLQCILMELGEIVLSKAHDKDDIRFKCGEVLTATFVFGCEIPKLIPCFPYARTKYKYSTDKDQTAKFPTLLKNMKEINNTYISIICNTWDPNSIRCLQEKIDNFTYTLWELSNTSDIHDLMSMTIQVYSHNHIVHEKAQLLSCKPFMKDVFEAKSIYPWKYIWNSYSNEFLEYINKCESLHLGKEYSMGEILEIMEKLIKHKLSDHKYTEDTVSLELSFFLNTPVNEIDIHDLRTIQYPLLHHLLSKTFEEIWINKHKGEWRNTGNKEQQTITLTRKLPTCILKPPVEIEPQNTHTIDAN